MLVTSGSYVGNGTSQSINVGFEPDLVIVKGDAALHGRYLTRWTFRAKSQAFGRNVTGLLEEAFLSSTGFSIDGATDWNQSGIDFYWVAFKDNGSEELETFSFNGNAVAGYTFTGLMKKKPEFMFAHRDNVRYGIAKLALHPDNESRSFNNTAGSGSFDAIRQLLPNGDFITSAAQEINEWAPPSGEATDCFAFYPSDQVEVIPYTGNGSTRQIATKVDSPQFVMVIGRADGDVPVWSCPAMQPATASGWNITLNAGNRINNISANQIQLGTDTICNGSGKEYWLLVVGATETVERNPLPARVSQTVARMVGTEDSKINVACGTDSNLSITGAMTMEWHGKLNRVGGGWSGWHETLMWRAAGDVGGVVTDGNVNWGIMYHNTYGLRIVTGTYFDINDVDNDIGSMWRTGIMLEDNNEYHIVVTHNGTGGWRLYINGKCVKTRDIDMVANYGVANISGIAAALTALHTRSTGLATTVESNLEGEMYCARVYDAELTAEEAKRRYQISMLRQVDLADPTTNLLESWFENGGDSTTDVNAGVDPTNNTGTVGGSGGQIEWDTRYD